jgi:hypothetical protein
MAEVIKMQMPTVLMGSISSDGTNVTGAETSF